MAQEQEFDITITDPFGNEKDYTPQKIVDSVMRAGFSKDEAKTIERRVRDRVDDTIASKELYVVVYEEMLKINKSYALRYRLREAIGVLDPNYAEFEKYMARVLAAHGYETEWSPRPLPQGACSEHEIDVLAEKNDTTFAVECKHHFHYHRLTGLDVTMIQYAVEEDLQAGYEEGLEHAIPVDESWVIVNTKLSQHAKNYAECKGIQITAWDYPEGSGLRELVEEHQTYPITILRPSQEQKKYLSKNDILTVQELIGLGEEGKTDIGLPNDELSKLQEKAQRLLNQ